MSCKKCPHHVRHGQVAADGKTIEFRDRCGLAMRQGRDETCKHYPFPKMFDYLTCDTYVQVFKTTGHRNDVVPTSDIQYSDRLAGSSITDMELL